METYTVKNADEFFLSDGEPGWRLTLHRASDGKQGSYIFPASTLEWRAAEYGLDPEDKDTLLDIVLHEPFAVGMTSSVRKDPAYAEKGLSVPSKVDKGRTRVGDPVPVTLMSAASVSDAREALLTRIAHTKQNGVQVVFDNGAEDLREKIKAKTPISRERYEDKRDHVEMRRKIKQGVKLSEKEQEHFAQLEKRIYGKEHPTIGKRGPLNG